MIMRVILLVSLIGYVYSIECRGLLLGGVSLI